MSGLPDNLDDPLLTATGSSGELVHAIRVPGTKWSTAWCGLAIVARYVPEPLTCRRCKSVTDYRKGRRP